MKLFAGTLVFLEMLKDRYIDIMKGKQWHFKVAVRYIELKIQRDFILKDFSESLIY